VASSFPAPPTAIVAADESGNSVRVPLTSSSFSVELASRHHYRLSIETEKGAVRIVYPRIDRVDGAFALSSEAAIVSLRDIRYIADVASPVVVAPDGACAGGVASDGKGLCTTAADRTQCMDDGYWSESIASCSYVDLVLGYGSLATMAATGPARGMFAVPSASPPCEVRGCDLPPDANPVVPPSD
jgi:hypothetical protein